MIFLSVFFKCNITIINGKQKIFNEKYNHFILTTFFQGSNVVVAANSQGNIKVKQFSKFCN